MNIYTISIPDAIPLGLITAKATYGIGFLTAIVGSFCSLLGKPNMMYTQKQDAAEAQAMSELLEKAKYLRNADGVMDVRCQIDGLSFLVFGTAYRLPNHTSSEQVKYSATPKAPQTSSEQVKHSATPKAPQPEKSLATEKKEVSERTNSIPAEDGKIICLLCDTKQNSNRHVCWNCGAKFYD